MKTKSLISALLVAVPVSGYADMVQLSEDCETALALSAGPASVRADAGVYLLKKSGYEKSRESTNGYYCLVERNHEDAVIPLCYDKPSQNANLQVVLSEGKLLSEGASFAELRERRGKLLQSGAVPQPGGPGVVYMISDYNYIYIEGQDAIVKVAPHVMFHAPGLDQSDIGASPQEAFSNKGVPLITAAGPHGFMTSFVERSSDSSAVESACAGQIPAKNSLPRFPPSAD